MGAVGRAGAGVGRLGGGFASGPDVRIDRIDRQCSTCEAPLGLRTAHASAAFLSCAGCKADSEAGTIWEVLFASLVLPGLHGVATWDAVWVVDG